MIQILVPRENVNDESVLVVAVNFPSGALVKKGDIVVSLETSKTNLDIEAPEDGVVTHQLKKSIEVDVGEILFALSNVDESRPEIRDHLDTQHDESLAVNKKSKVKFSIAAIKRAKELGVNLSQFDNGWVTSADIENYVGMATPKTTFHSAAPYKKIEEKEALALDVSSTNFSISKRKQAEAKNLITGEHGNTTSTIGIEIKVLGERMVRPSFLFRDSISDLIVFEASRLLAAYPELNGYHVDKKTWSQYDQVNFGWSFDNGKNLKVLAIKNANKLNLPALQEEVGRLLDLYDSGETIPVDLLTVSTVTFSDLSRTTASFMLPLINGHQTLILGLIRKSKTLYEIFASFDHRVTEGLSVVNFLTDLRERVLSYFIDKNGILQTSCFVCKKSMSDELALGHRGFIKMILANGDDANFCRNCFEGH